MQPEPAVSATASSRRGTSRPIVAPPRLDHSLSLQQTLGVVLIGRNQLLVNALALSLVETAQVQVLKTYERIEETLTELGRVDKMPDVVVVDYDRGASERASEVRAFCQAWPLVHVVMTSVPPDVPTVVACIEAGARGLLSVDSGLDVLVPVIHTVVKGQAACSPAITTLMLDAIATGAPVGALTTQPILTRRERQVVRLLERGLSNKEIARQLDIKVATVKNHVHNILAKLKLSNRGRVRGPSGSGLLGSD